MKKFLLVLVLAVALLGLLAAPAFAGSVPTARVSFDTAYIFGYGGGTWCEAGGDVNSPYTVWHFATYDDNDNLVKPADRIPANYDVVMDGGFGTYSLGLVQSISGEWLIQLSIPTVGVNLSYAQSKAYWTGPTQWDEYWVGLLGPFPPAFNPSLGAQGYCNHWWVPLTGNKGIATNLTVDNKLPKGSYTVYYTETWAHTYTCLDMAWDDMGNPLTTPYHIPPGGPYVANPFTFTIGRPVK
jgi:hypothetical protein